MAKNSSADYRRILASTDNPGTISKVTATQAGPEIDISDSASLSVSDDSKIDIGAAVLAAGQRHSLNASRAIVSIDTHASGFQVSINWSGRNQSQGLGLSSNVKGALEEAIRESIQGKKLAKSAKRKVSEGRRHKEDLRMSAFEPTRDDVSIEAIPLIGVSAPVL